MKQVAGEAASANYTKLLRLIDSGIRASTYTNCEKCTTTLYALKEHKTPESKQVIVLILISIVKCRSATSLLPVSSVLPIGLCPSLELTKTIRCRNNPSRHGEPSLLVTRLAGVAHEIIPCHRRDGKTWQTSNIECSSWSDSARSRILLYQSLEPGLSFAISREVPCFSPPLVFIVWVLRQATVQQASATLSGWEANHRHKPPPERLKIVKDHAPTFCHYSTPTHRPSLRPPPVVSIIYARPPEHLPVSSMPGALRRFSSANLPC